MGRRKRKNFYYSGYQPSEKKENDKVPGNTPPTVVSSRSGATVVDDDDDDFGYYYGGYPYHGGYHHHGYRATTYKPKPEVDPVKKLLLEKMMVAHCIEEVPEDCKKSVIYIMQGDGIYERRKNRLGTFTTRIAEVEIPGLKKDLEEDWELNVPKIPATYLGTTVAFFRNIYKKHSSEVFLQFFYDLEKEEYILHCPKQTVSGASVRYTNDENFEDDTKILVFEIHSHGNMGAFFSGTDDSDEKADRFYGVIGNITQHFPDMKIRLSVGGRTSDVDVDEIFDVDEEMYHLENYPKDWAERIKEEKVKKVRARSFPGRNGLLGFPGHGRYFPGQQGCLFGETDIDEMDLVEKFESNDYLMSQGEFVPDDDDNPGGYWLQEGNKLWRIEDGKKVYFMEDGECYYMVEDDDDDDDSEIVIIEDSDPTDHRGKRF